MPGLFRNTEMWVVLVFGAALILRVLWSLHVECDPRTYWRWDMTVYDYQAYALAQGHGYVDFSGNPTAHWPPGYSAALAPLYRLTDNSLLAARLMNAVAGSLTVVLVYLLGARVFSRAAGLVGAALLAAFPNQILSSSLILTEPLFTALFVLILLLAVYTVLGRREPHPWQVVLIGLLIGVAALVRGEGLLLAAIIPLLMFARRPSWHTALARSGLLVLGAAIVVLPWTARNAVRMKAPIIISTSATEALWVGHHEGADGKIADFDVATAYADLSNPEKDVKINNEALRQALEFIRNNPVEEFRLIPRRFAALHGGDSSSITWLQTPPTISVEKAKELHSLSDVSYWIVVALAALGLPAWLSLRDPRKALLVVVAVSWTLLFSIVFFGDERFHFSLIPIFCLWAGVSLTAIGQIILRMWRRSNMRVERA